MCVFSSQVTGMLLKKQEAYDLSSDIASQGSMFSSDFLTESIRSVSEWESLSDAEINQFEGIVRKHFDNFPMRNTRKLVMP